MASFAVNQASPEASKSSLLKKTCPSWIGSKSNSHNHCAKVLVRLHCHYRIKAADGDYRWVDDHGMPIRNQSGRTIRLVGAVSDVTAEKEQARQGEILFQQFNAVLDTIDYGVLFMGPELQGKIINRAFRKMWGISDQFIQDTQPSMADLINYNRYNDIYNVPEASFDDYVAKRGLR